jgi:hypothetical protein
MLLVKASCMAGCLQLQVVERGHTYAYQFYVLNFLFFLLCPPDILVKCNLYSQTVSYVNHMAVF